MPQRGRRRRAPLAQGVAVSLGLSRPHQMYTVNRYAPFLTVVLLSAGSPALPHSFTPDYAWWGAAIGFIALMVATGYLGSKRTPRNWLNVLAPLLLFPAI